MGRPTVQRWRLSRCDDSTPSQAMRWGMPRPRSHRRRGVVVACQIPLLGARMFTGSITQRDQSSWPRAPSSPKAAAARCDPTWPRRRSWQAVPGARADVDLRPAGSTAPPARPAGTAPTTRPAPAVQRSPPAQREDPHGRRGVAWTGADQNALDLLALRDSLQHADTRAGRRNLGRGQQWLGDNCARLRSRCRCGRGWRGGMR